MAIFFNPRTHCSGCGEVLKSMFFDFLICLLNVLSCILVFFIEPITTGQIVFVIMVTIITFGTYTFDLLSSDGCEHMLQIQKTMTLSTLISVIMWMCPISVFWSLIPFGIAIFLLSSLLDTDKIPWLSIVCSTMLLAFLFSYSQDNLNIKRHLQSNPQSEVVTISNFDSGEVFFINEQTSHLKFHSLKTQQDAINLNLQKGDTVKIVRHPNNPKLVIKISK